MASIIRAAALTPRPWPNGLGITRDVAAQNRTDTGFDWLISIADLAESAAFSHFPDCNRIFTLIEGEDVTLTLDDARPMACRLFVPVSFPGDHPSFCTMGAGPARAFNLFVDRPNFDGRVAVRMIAPGREVWTSARTEAIYCAAGALDVPGGVLEAGDTVIGTGAGLMRAGAWPAIAVIVEIETLGPV